jgi:hypothetical protein
MLVSLEVSSHDAVAAGEAMPLGRQSNDPLAAYANHVRILHLARQINSTPGDLSSHMLFLPQPKLRISRGSALTGRDKTANT